MKMLESDATISKKNISPIPTSGAASPTLTIAGDDRFKNRDAWPYVLDLR
jgi:hypothetical protein